jgi:centromeric protein E
VCQHGDFADLAYPSSDYVPFRNSKLTRMLQPSLSGDARISVICTLNPDTSAVPESTNTLLFAQRIKKVALHAKKKEIVDADALIERYRKEIEDLKQRLAEREEDAPVRNRRLSERQVGLHGLGREQSLILAAANGRNKGDERPQHPNSSAHQADSHESKR